MKDAGATASRRPTSGASACFETVEQERKLTWVNH